MTGTKILVVDDDPGLRALLKVRLEASGYDLTLAEGGVAALEHVTEKAFGAALVDLRLEHGQHYAARQTPPQTTGLASNHRDCAWFYCQYVEARRKALTTASRSLRPKTCCTVLNIPRNCVPSKGS